jgi:hypothetical protein
MIAAIIGFSGVTHAESFPLDTCHYLLDTSGNYFVSTDKSMDASLWYAKGSDGVSGGVSEKVDGHKKEKAPLIDSHCNNGIVTLNWEQPGFSGQLVGTLDVQKGSLFRITNVSGNVNGESISQDFMYAGNPH